MRQKVLNERSSLSTAPLNARESERRSSNSVREAAKAKGCRRLWLITTNDNLDALGFYQRRGLRLTALYPNAPEASRKLKPEISMKAANGIPIRDELELELELSG